METPIEQYTHSHDGAACHERDIMDGQIEKQVFNGSTLCIVNDQICEEYYDARIGNTTTLEDCLNTGNYPLTDICGEQQLKVLTTCVYIAVICIPLMQTGLHYNH